MLRASPASPSPRGLDRWALNTGILTAANAVIVLEAMQRRRKGAYPHRTGLPQRHQDVLIPASAGDARRSRHSQAQFPKFRADDDSAMKTPTPPKSASFTCLGGYGQAAVTAVADVLPMYSRGCWKGGITDVGEASGVESTWDRDGTVDGFRVACSLESWSPL